MAIKDVLLPLVGDPNPSAVAAIEKCVATAGNIGARISALAVQIDVELRPRVMMSDDLDNTEAAESMRSVSDAQGLPKAFGAAAARFGVRHGQQLKRFVATDIAAGVAHEARLKDMTLVPLKLHDGQSQKIVEQLLFHSGRPVLLCPEEFAGALASKIDSVAIAWDHTAPAARAVADALPLLKSAARVRIITATDQNTPAELESGAALVEHLREHAVNAAFETVAIAGSSVGKVFEADVRANAIDLLVMGAYRHSRLNQFVWGGATETVIGRPPCWVMMSH